MKMILFIAVGAAMMGWAGLMYCDGAIKQQQAEISYLENALLLATDAAFDADDRARDIKARAMELLVPGEVE